MRNKIMIALIMLAAILSTANTYASVTSTVAVKNGQTLTVYVQRTYDNGESEISSSTYTGTDVSTLRSIGIPENAWPLFANSTNLLFSTEAFVLEQQKKEIEATLEETSEDRDWNANQFGGFRNAFWIMLFFSVVAIVILSVKLRNANKRK